MVLFMFLRTSQSTHQYKKAKKYGKKQKSRITYDKEVDRRKQLATVALKQDKRQQTENLNNKSNYTNLS